MASRELGRRRWLLVGGVTILATGWAVSAQSPAPGQAPAPAQGPAAQVEQGRGGGGRGRGGPEVLQGGPQLDDPAYANYDFAKRAPLLPLSPEEQLKKFILQPGYRLELVLSDPVIEEPAAVTFDGNGRMFVIQIRGYMMDADATGQLDPIGRVSMHVDTNNDGVYDKHTISPTSWCSRASRRRSARTRCSSKSRMPRSSGNSLTPTATESPTRKNCSTPDTAAWATSSTRKAT